MMKNKIKRLFIRLVGFNNYLFIFSIFKILQVKVGFGEKEFLAFLKIVKKGATVLDVGANVGIMSVLLAKKVGNGRVLAFEPIPSNIYTIKKVLAYFKIRNVEVFDFALGSMKAQSKMIMPIVNDIPMQGLSHLIHEDISEFNSGEEFIVKIETVDELDVITRGVDAIKIDVENHEYFVLQGAEKTIRKYNPIIFIELWPNEMREKCFKFINEMNYNVFVLCREKLCHFDSKIHKKHNFIFVPN